MVNPQLWTTALSVYSVSHAVSGKQPFNIQTEGASNYLHNTSFVLFLDRK